MIADLGLSKQLTEVTSNSAVYGMLEYIEPQCYKIDSYIRDKRSDIYSLGVLLWELTSCSSPFNFENLDDFDFHERERIRRRMAGNPAHQKFG